MVQYSPLEDLESTTDRNPVAERTQDVTSEARCALENISEGKWVVKKGKEGDGKRIRQGV